jgi:hypothetical protein
MSASRIDWLVARGVWLVIHPGVYLVDVLVNEGMAGSDGFATRLNAALLLHGRHAVACLDSAARVYGLPVPPGRTPPIQLCLPRGAERHQRPGIDLHFRQLPAGAVSDVLPRGESASARAVRATSLTQTVADVLRTWHDWDAVSLLDAALASGALPAGWRDTVEASVHRGRGALAARRRLPLGDARAQSPLETRVRLIATAAGLPPDELQHPIRDDRGVLLGYADLVWFKPDGRTLVVEADGRRWHELPEALFRDRRRANDFSGVGDVDMVRFTWADTRRSQYIVGMLQRHLRPSRNHPRAS